MMRPTPAMSSEFCLFTVFALRAQYGTYDTLVRSQVSFLCRSFSVPGMDEALVEAEAYRTNVTNDSGFESYSLGRPFLHVPYILQE